MNDTTTAGKTYRIMTTGRGALKLHEGTLEEVAAWLDANTNWRPAGSSHEKRSAWRMPWKDIQMDVEVCSQQVRGAGSETACAGLAWVPDNDVRHLTHRSTP